MLHEIAPKKLTIAYSPETPSPADKVLYMREGKLLLKGEDPLSFPSYGEFTESGLCLKNQGEWTYLFRIDETKYFTIRYDEKEVLYEEMKAGLGDFSGRAQGLGFSLIPHYALRNMGPREAAFAGLLGCQLIGWYGRTRFCGRCGGKLRHDGKERMMRCPDCGNMIFPQICPAVIIGIFHEGKLLVTRYNPNHMMFDSSGKTFKPTVKDSLVAGYIEAGETAEECVAREAMEEVGLKVKNIRFYKDSPWPLSSSLLLSFLCEVDGDPTVKVEKDELSRAVWVTREEIIPGPGSGFSLTGTMMEDFKKGLIP